MRSVILKSILIIFTIFITGTNAQSWYPLETGNRWDYKFSGWDPMNNTYSEDSSFVYVIGDTLLPNGKTYAVLSDDLYFHTKFVRVYSDKIYLYYEFDNSDVPLFDFNAELGEWKFFDNGPFGIVELFDTNQVEIFGESHKSYYFEADGLIPADFRFVEGYGLVSYGSGGEPPGSYISHNNLLGCILSGVQHGNLITKVEELTRPLNFKLYQNYPNPFNPSTKIRYSISSSVNSNEQGKLTNLHVYDILGRIVATLVNEKQVPGEYEIKWSADELPNGIYFARLSVNGFSDTIKLVLLK